MERWKVNLYTLWAAQIISMMSFGFCNPFMAFYVQELGVTNPDSVKTYTGLLQAAPAVTMAIMSPIWGIAADKWGKKFMLLRAMLSASLVIFGCGLVTSADQLVVLRFIQGLFTGTVAAASILVASSTPNNRMSYALGFMSSSTFIGFSMGPMIGGIIAEHFGYRTSFYSGATLMFIDFLLVMFIVKEDRTLTTVAAGETKEKIPFLAVFNTVVISTCLIMFFTRMGNTVFNPYLPLYIQEIRSSMEGAAQITGVISGLVGLATAFSGIILSRLGDRYEKMWLVKVMMFTGVGLSLPLIFIKDLWGFTALYCVLFFVMGGIEPIMASAATECTAPERRGAVLGMQNLVGSVGFAISPLIAGMVSIKFSLSAILVLIPFTISLGLIALLFFNKGRNKSCEKN